MAALWVFNQGGGGGVYKKGCCQSREREDRVDAALHRRARDDDADGLPVVDVDEVTATSASSSSLSLHSALVTVQLLATRPQPHIAAKSGGAAGAGARAVSSRTGT